MIPGTQECPTDVLVPFGLELDETTPQRVTSSQNEIKQTCNAQNPRHRPATAAAANRVMLAHFSNEAILLRGVCAELARQNACLARAFAVQLANNGKPARPQHGR